ncbi:DUF309 domain-containing protein [Cytobacillus sp. IB215665]|uniref:DUF309 domain-containing protein n=1 Tax=Cytobacillus sp. IB215665 TaxID=3097357 RepID=UPI002A0B6303|nr:DUF309 domain-containing protein [Cytobacillus sp. IB215665]MDX8365908.1 DUF309 domain-containing protein [Cytobacillus sp. IB215665]
MANYPLEYYQFFIKFNEGDYYTCHDLLEEIWMTEKHNYFLKGLLQMTVALYHYGYGNVEGARLMMRAGHQYIQKYRPSYWGINLEEVNEFIEKCLIIIPQDVERVPFENIDRLPKLPTLLLYLNEEREE